MVFSLKCLHTGWGDSRISVEGKRHISGSDSESGPAKLKRKGCRRWEDVNVEKKRMKSLVKEKGERDEG